MGPWAAQIGKEGRKMQVGMVGLGRMGSGMVRRLMAKGHECVVYDHQPAAIKHLESIGAIGAPTLEQMVQRLARPRAIWLMVPAAVVDDALAKLVPLLNADDTVIDGGNSYYRDDIRRGADLKRQGIHYVDVGTSGGLAGFERGYCLMIGGELDVARRLEPVFSALAPGAGTVALTNGRKTGGSDAEQGFLHCGPCGAGHFVKMVHNGIEYGMMAAYAEGLNILHKANIGQNQREPDAETTPLRHPEFYQYALNLPDITEVWRRGSVITSWLLDLTAAALQQDPELLAFDGRVSDSGEGRWTVQAAIDEGVPVPVISAALYQRFASRGEDAFAARILSAMRHGFGGHSEKTAGENPSS